MAAISCHIPDNVVYIDDMCKLAIIDFGVACKSDKFRQKMGEASYHYPYKAYPLKFPQVVDLYYNYTCDPAAKLHAVYMREFLYCFYNSHFHVGPRRLPDNMNCRTK